MCSQHIDLWSWMQALFWHQFYHWSLQVLCTVITQGGGQWAVHSDEGCCSTTNMVRTSIYQKLPGLVSRPGVIIHGCCCWEAAAGVSPLIAAAAAAACCCNCNCICCCCNKNNNKIAMNERENMMRHQKWKDNSSLRKALLNERTTHQQEFTGYIAE